MKKVLSIVLCMSLCIMCTLPISAAEVMPKKNGIEKEEVSTTSGSNYFSKILPKLNSINGTVSNVVTFSSGSISGSERVVTSISLYVRVSSGSDPFIIYIQAPDGTIYSFVITTSGTITIDNFNGCDPKGSWKIWIETQGTVSSATITAKICYDYSY